MSKAEESVMSERIGQAEEAVTQLGKEGSRLKEAAQRFVQNGKTVAQRWGRQGVRATGELTVNTREHIKHDPVRSALISFVIGLAIGTFIGWGSTRHPSPMTQDRPSN